MVKTSIKGFELKNITHFLGHEQEDCYQGSIYYKDKKVGFYTDDSWGGSPIIDFYDTEIDKIFKVKAKEYLLERYPNDKIYQNCIDVFFTELLQLISAHNDFVRDQKKGFTLIAILSQGSWLSEREISFKSEQDLRRYALQEKLKIEKIFKEDKDFIID